jgi:GGDEF domain-containing protein
MSEEFDKSLLLIGETQLPLLAIGVWDAEPSAIGTALAQVSQRPYIAYARLTADVGAVFEVGDSALHGHPNARLFNLAQPNYHELSIGTLELVPDPLFLYSEIGHSLGFALVGYVILCCLIILLLKREVERPLRHVLEYVTGSPRMAAPRCLRPCAGRSLQRDEIDMVVEGFQTLHQKIDLRMRELDAEVESRTNALQSAMEWIDQLSIMDPLTACYNRRLFDERIREEAERGQRLQRPLTLVFADIDFFKRVNDKHGRLLRATEPGAPTSAPSCAVKFGESVDWVVRYGGEEFRPGAAQHRPRASGHLGTAVTRALSDCRRALARAPDRTSARDLQLRRRATRIR